MEQYINSYILILIEEVEIMTLKDLEFALITGVPKNPVNEIEKVAEFAADKAKDIDSEINEMDFTDIPITL